MGYNSVTEEQQNKCAELWSEYESDMRKTCRAKLRGLESEMEEAIGDLSFAFCNQIKRNGFPDNTKAWLYGTLYNIINEKLRDKYKREKYLTDIDAELIELPCQTDFVDIVESNERLEQVEKVIPTLKKEDQIVLHEVYFNNKSMRNIAEEMGSTETAVKQRRYRACYKVREEIE